MKKAALVLLLLSAGICSAYTQHTKEVRKTNQSNPAIQYGDILMRSLRVWPKDDTDERNTLEAAKDFKVDKIVWIYENTSEFNEKVRAEGISIGTTMASNARDKWMYVLTEDEKMEFVKRYTLTNLNGDQVMPAHMRRMGPGSTITHFQPDQTNDKWMEYYTDYVTGLYQSGIDALHRDDPASCSSAPRHGGTFTKSAVDYFREYLEKNFNPEELIRLGVQDVATFDVQSHFKSLGAPLDHNLWQWKGSNLMSIYQDAMMQADREFFLEVKSTVEERTGLVIPWSLNAGGPVRPLEDAFDFRVGEFQSHHNQPQTLLIMSGYPRRAGKMQGLISMVDGRWTEHPTEFVADTRKHIATAYACGMIPLVPWCMYMHAAPRYYGTTEDFGDLYHFVSAQRHFFDGHELVNASGIDTRSHLYSLDVNKELHFEEGDLAARVWINQPNIFAFVRKKVGADAVVIHLTDWNEQSQPFQVTFSPDKLIGSSIVKLTLHRPGKTPVVISRYQGETIELPEIDPWGLLVVEAEAKAIGSNSAPKILRPAQAVVPQGAIPVFEHPHEGQHVMARYVPDVAEREISFMKCSKKAPFIDGKGFLEAYTFDPKTRIGSDTVRIRFHTYQDYSIADDQSVTKRKTEDLTGKFNVTSGEMIKDGSWLSDKMMLMGKEVSRGISTKGDVTLTTVADPSWKCFSVRVGLDDAEDRRPCVRFQVLFDDKIVYETPIVNPTKLVLDDNERRDFQILLEIPEGVKKIRLRANNGGFFADQNTVIWADPKAYL
jgi:hypothetical protein